MAVTAKTIPSISVPFTDSQGRINPIWHEFLRSFVSNSVDGTITGNSGVSSVTAANGLVSTEDTKNVVLRVGQGNGIAVNADDVNVDIGGLPLKEAALTDEIMISDPVNNNILSKTKVRNIVGLSAAGGLDGQVQYNNAGIFAADAGFTYYGSGVVGINGTLTINGVNFSSNSNTERFVFSVPGGSAQPHFTIEQSSGGSAMPVDLRSFNASVSLRIHNDSQGGGSTVSESNIMFMSVGQTRWTLGMAGTSSSRVFTLGTTGLNVGNAFYIDEASQNFRIGNSLLMSVQSGITASTVQTQGNGTLIYDVNEISTVSNTNDVVTLPTAVTGRTCLVINNGVEVLQVFPASGDDLGNGLNISTTINADDKKLFVSYNNTNWVAAI